MTLQERLQIIADSYATELKTQVDQRLLEMQSDDKSHYLVYRVLGVSLEEGDAIDLYQNKGRFLYRYAGAFLERAARLCFEETFPEVATMRIPNTLGSRPRTFEIDCLVENLAHEFKWRDATTDGDHITKEHTRLRVIADAGYIPVRVMFYYPNRQQAMRIQAVLADLYKSVGGAYYHGDAAWDYISQKTGVDLKRLLENIAQTRGT
jgi:ApaLI-like restriction endonuclease